MRVVLVSIAALNVVGRCMSKKKEKTNKQKKKECLLWFLTRQKPSCVRLRLPEGPLGAGTNDLSTLHVLFIRVESHENYTEWNCAVFSRGAFTSCFQRLHFLSSNQSTSCLPLRYSNYSKTEKSQRLTTVLREMKDISLKTLISCIMFSVFYFYFPISKALSIANTNAKAYANNGIRRHQTKITIFLWLSATCKFIATLWKTKLLTNQSREIAHWNLTAQDTKKLKVCSRDLEPHQQEAKAPLNVVVVLNLIFVWVCLRLMF